MSGCGSARPSASRSWAGEKVIRDVRTEVRDGALEVRFDHSDLLVDDVVVEATVPRLDGIEVTGSGDVEADGIEARAFDVLSDGSGDADVAGAADRLVP